MLELTLTNEDSAKNVFRRPATNWLKYTYILSVIHDTTRCAQCFKNCHRFNRYRFESKVSLNEKYKFLFI